MTDALMNTVAFVSAADLRENAMAIPAETLAAFRGNFVETYERKLNGMRNVSAGNASRCVKFQRDAAAGHHDAALRVMLCTGIPADFFVRKVRGARDNDADSFNFYAIPKALLLARMMLSSAPIWGTGSDARTLRGTIAGLLAGAHTQRKGLAAFLNDYMTAQGAGRGGSYSAGNTQASSSAHALAAMGLLSIPSQGDYVIPQGHAEGALRSLMGQHAAGNATADDDSADAATHAALSA